MVKRLLLIVALGAAIAACSPAGGSGSPGTETLAPIESMPVESPVESMGTESASPAP